MGHQHRCGTRDAPHAWRIHRRQLPRQLPRSRLNASRDPQLSPARRLHARQVDDCEPGGISLPHHRQIGGSPPAVFSGRIASTSAPAWYLAAGAAAWAAAGTSAVSMADEAVVAEGPGSLSVGLTNCSLGIRRPSPPHTVQRSRLRSPRARMSLRMAGGRSAMRPHLALWAALSSGVASGSVACGMSPPVGGPASLGHSSPAGIRVGLERVSVPTPSHTVTHRARASWRALYC